MILEFGNILEGMHFLFFFITKNPDHYLKQKGIGKGRKREEDGKKKLVMANVTKMEYVWPANLFYVGKFSTAIIHCSLYSNMYHDIVV